MRRCPAAFTAAVRSPPRVGGGPFEASRKVFEAAVAPLDALVVTFVGLRA